MSEGSSSMDADGRERITVNDIAGSGYSFQVSCFGGQVISWKNNRGEELLYLSSKAFTKPGLYSCLWPDSEPPVTIHGGITLCFPQFSRDGPSEFARKREWDIDESPPPLPSSSDRVFVDLILRSTENDNIQFPHRFEFRLRVGLRPTGDLVLTSRIRNVNSDGRPFRFSFAYHNFLSVSHISEVRVEGLDTWYYLDNLQNKELFTEQDTAITFESELDRVYLSTGTTTEIMDHAKRQTFLIQKQGLLDTAVWNPWDKKVKVLGDFAKGEYEHMLCVSPATVENQITLRPGEEWTGRQKLGLVDRIRNT